MAEREQFARQARRLRRILLSAVFARRLLSALPPVCFAAGAVILGARLLSGWSGADSACAVLTGILCALAYAAFRTKAPSAERLTVWLDSASGAGGLLASSAELPLGPWERILPAVPEIRFRFEWTKFLLPLILSGAFLAAAAAVPVSRFSEPEQKRRLDVSRQAEGLREKLEVLEQESLLPEKDLAEARKHISELAERNDAGDSARTYEILDTLNSKIAAAGEQAAAAAVRSAETLDNLSKTLDNLGETPSAGASEQLSSLMKKLSGEDPALAELLSKTGIDPSRLSAEDRSALSKAMKARSKELAEQLKKLAEKKLCSSGACRKPGEGSSGENSELEEWLKANAEENGELCREGSGAPGKGGVSRGRGDADLQLSGAAPDYKGRMADLSLPETAVGKQPRGETVAEFRMAPDSSNLKAESAKAGTLSGKAAFDARPQSVRPEHRAAVRHYFTNTQPTENR